MMARLRALIYKEFLVLLRDRQGLALLFLLPVIFIVIMSVAMQGALQLGGKLQERVLIVDLAQTRSAGYLTDALRSAGRFPLDAVTMEGDADGAARLQEGIRAGEYRIGVLIPPGFQAGGDNEVVLYYAPTLLPEVRRTFSFMAASGLEQAAARRGLQELAPGDLDRALGDGLGEGRMPTMREQVVHAGDSMPAVPSAVQHSVPAWLVFSMFFVVAPIAASLIVERDQGTLRRLRQMGVPTFWMLGSRLIPYYLVNMGQLVLMLGAGVYLVPLFGGERLDPGDNALGLWLVASAVSFAAIGLALLIASLSRTVVQATLSGGVFCLILGALGGVMVPKAVMPPAMQELALVSPMSWGLEGFWDILLRQGGVSEVLSEVAMLALFGGLSWGLAALTAAWRNS